MELREVISNRRSVRKFTDQKIPKEDLVDIVQAAHEAPSAHNKQMWKFTAVTNTELNEKCADAVLEKIDKIVEEYEITEPVKAWKKFSTFFSKSPAVIYVFYEEIDGFLEKTAGQKGMSKEEIERLRAHPELQSVGGAIQNLLLAAYEKGYGTCWMTAPMVAAPEIEKVLNVNNPLKLCAVIPMGIPAKDSIKPPKKSLEEVLEIIE